MTVHFPDLQIGDKISFIGSNLASSWNDAVMEMLSTCE
jgi:hypothetical protein